jgi:hypothetical protein
MNPLYLILGLGGVFIVGSAIKAAVEAGRPVTNQEIDYVVQVCAAKETDPTILHDFALLLRDAGFLHDALIINHKLMMLGYPSTLPATDIAIGTYTASRGSDALHTLSAMAKSGALQS